MGTEEEEVNISLLPHKLEDCYEPSALVLRIGHWHFFLFFFFWNPIKAHSTEPSYYVAV